MSLSQEKVLIENINDFEQLYKTAKAKQSLRLVKDPKNWKLRTPKSIKQVLLCGSTFFRLDFGNYFETLLKSVPFKMSEVDILRVFRTR